MSTLKGYQFIRKVVASNPYGTSTIHVWSVKRENTLCNMKNNMKEVDTFEKTLTVPRGKFCITCETKLEELVTGKVKKHKGPKIAPPRPEEEQYLNRWKGSKSAPSLWEKMERDPAFDYALKTRDIGENGSTMSNSWGVGKPKSPN